MSQKLGYSTRENVNLQEKLKVTEELLEAQEIEQEEREELENKRRKLDQNYTVSIE